MERPQQAWVVAQRGFMLGNLADIVRDRYRLASEVHGDLGVDIDEYQTHLERISDRYLGAQRNVEAEALFVQSLHLYPRHGLA